MLRRLTRRMSPKVVLLYGLSANPPVGLGGHQGYVKYFTRQDWLDELWIMPVYKHMYADKQNLVDFKHRFSMCKIAFEQNKEVNFQSKAKVIDVEKTCVENAFADANAADKKAVDVRVGSYQVVTHLYALNPDTHFCFVMGGDAYNDLCAGKWNDTDAFKESVGIVHIPRIGYDVNDDLGTTALPPAKGTATTVRIPGLTDSSSTQARNAAAHGNLSLLRSLLDEKVMEYILDEKLYGLENENSEYKQITAANPDAHATLYKHGTVTYTPSSVTYKYIVKTDTPKAVSDISDTEDTTSTVTRHVENTPEEPAERSAEGGIAHIDTPTTSETAAEVRSTHTTAPYESESKVQVNGEVLSINTERADISTVAAKATKESATENHAQSSTYTNSIRKASDDAGVSEIESEIWRRSKRIKHD
eukprot:CFRG8131T1